MHVLASDQETVIILIPKDLSHEDRMDTMREIKSFLLTYNKIYHFLKVGFYQVEVSFNKLIGTLLKIIYIEELDFKNGFVQELGEHEEEYVPKWDVTI